MGNELKRLALRKKAAQELEDARPKYADLDKPDVFRIAKECDLWYTGTPMGDLPNDWGVRFAGCTVRFNKFKRAFYIHACSNFEDAKKFARKMQDFVGDKITVMLSYTSTQDIDF